MKQLTQGVWIALQGGIFCAVIWLWSIGPTPDRGPLHVAVLGGAFLAYTFTFCTLMLVEAVKEISRWMAKRRQRKLYR